MQNLILILLLLATVLKTSSAIDEKSAEESPCFNISSANDPDADWVNKNYDTNIKNTN